MRKTKDIRYQTFHNLTPIDWVPRPSSGEHCWRCICSCGNTCYVSTTELNKGTTKSCGCQKSKGKRNPSYKHGKTYSKEHNSWCAIKKRCYNPKTVGYEHYGGRGIKVCDRWLESFENFYADMGPCPYNKTSLNRIDNNGDYTPDNCEWADDATQANNRSNNNLITFNGETKPIGLMATKYGIKRHRVYDYRKKHKVDFNTAFAKVVERDNPL